MIRHGSFEVAEVVGQGLETHGCSALIDALGVGQVAGLVDTFHSLDLGAVELGGAFGEEDPVGEVGDVAGLHVTSGHGRHERQAPPLKIWFTVGVLG